MRYVITLILIFGYTLKSFSQETVLISEADLLSRPIENNPQVKLALSEANVVEAELRRSRSMYLPDVMASYSYMNTNNPLMAFGFRLNQERIRMEDFNPDLLNDPSNISSFGTKLEIRQPIINMDAVYQKKAGQVRVKAINAKAERTKEYIRYELKKAYLMLQLAYKMEATLRNAMATALSNKAVVENYFKNGLIQQSDVLMAEVHVTGIADQIQVSKSNIKNTSDYIYFLLGDTTSEKTLVPVDSLEIQGSFPNLSHELNMNRKDLASYTQSLNAYHWMIKSSKSTFLPRLNGFGSYEIYDKNVGRFRASGYLVGLQLSWNIFDGLKSFSEQRKIKADLLKTETEMQQYIRQSRLELKKTSRQVQDAWMKITSARKSWDQSKEVYRIRKNRFDQGLEKSSDLLSAETLVSQKELEYQQSVYEYNIAWEYYQFLQ